VAKQKKSLVRKLNLVMKSVDNVIKRGKNETDNYVYATADDVKEAFREKFIKYGIFAAPRELEAKRYPIEFAVRGGMVNSFVTELRVEWTFYDADGDSPIVCIVTGSGEDQGAVGCYKALTGSLKALLMSTHLLRSGEDPDADSKAALKEMRKKKPEEVPAEEKASIPLWYSHPEEAKGLEVAVRGTDEALSKYKDELMYRGKWSPKHKCYIVSIGKLDDLKFVLQQQGVDLKELKNANNPE
jgi:ERF superfamily